MPEQLRATRHTSEATGRQFSSRSGFSSALAAPGQQRWIQAVPGWQPVRRKVPLPVRINRALRTVLLAMCGVAILGYGLDVAASADASNLQEQVRRLNEQNTELSAELLRVISFQGIQDSVLGRFGLRVPERVLIVKEVHPFLAPSFTPGRYHLPLMSGY